MRVNICDPCAAGRKLALASYRLKVQGGVSVSLCIEHRDIGKGKTPDYLLKVALDAEAAMMAVQNEAIAKVKKVRTANA